MYMWHLPIGILRGSLCCDLESLTVVNSSKSIYLTSTCYLLTISFISSGTLSSSCSVPVFYRWSSAFFHVPFPLARHNLDMVCQYCCVVRLVELGKYNLTVPEKYFQIACDGRKAF
uniref:Uncharacterized protein n=1 Tax=Cacopsylla melanoneura TaxID=428564 RepID=A0A8D8X486_9HEMI